VDVQIGNLMRGQSLLDQIVRSDAALLVLHERFLKAFKAVQDEARNIKKVILVPEAENRVVDITKFDLKADGVLLTDILANGSPTVPNIDVKWHDPESVTYSSGTTGPPKGIKVPHNYEFEYCWAINKHMYTTRWDVIAILYPMYNVTGRAETSLRSLMADCRAVLFDHFDAETFWDDVRRYGITQCEFVGGVILPLLKSQASSEDANNPLRVVFTAAAGTPLELKQEFERRFDALLLEVYGQTEIGVATMEPVYARKIGSQGVACGHFEVKITDEKGQEVPSGRSGEIVVRPLKPHVMMLEYYKMPEKTAETYRDGWVHTGDRGHLDEDGYLYFEARMVECIRTRGFMTSVTQIEEIINSHPAVAECGAKGVPASKGGEEDVMVYVQLGKGMSLSHEELLHHCEKNMPYYMVPSFVEFVEDLPKTSTLKINRGELAERSVSEKTWDRRKAGYKLKRG
jgi:crotonobetaine/carnitine-CoA ligase